LKENETPQLLFIEVREQGEELFEALAALAEVCNPDSKVVLLGAANDIPLYKRLMDMGLSEYHCGEVTTEGLIALVEGIFSGDDPSQLGRVVAFIGARGGVGSSALAANTAYGLGQQFKEPVILMDLDLPFGTSALALNLQQRQSVADALAQPGRLDEVLMERFALKYDDHLSVIPAPSLLDGNDDVNLESFGVLVKLVRKMAAFVVIDVPHRWSPWVEALLLDANDVVVTACPDLLNLRDAKNIFDSLAPKRGIEAPVRLVFNRVGQSKKTELTAKDFEEPLKVKPAAAVPYDPGLFGTAVNNGTMIQQAAKGSRAAKEIAKLANAVSARMPSAKAKKKGSLLAKLGLSK
jgi:pilus assembly protein CpaE